MVIGTHKVVTNENRKKILKIFKNQLILKIGNSFYLNLKRACFNPF